MQNLAEMSEQIMHAAQAQGLDPFPMHLVTCPASTIRTIAAYGMPTRYAHWSFGKAYHRLVRNESLGLGKIYELVINHNPCYAYLCDTNTPLQNKLIISHVIAHSDFFRHNIHFAETNRQMVATMTQAADRLQVYARVMGRTTVERFVDAGQALQVHEGVLDVVRRHGKRLADWQLDVLAILEEEMAYFRPQMATKVANEGWATYWHRRIMRALVLDEAETVAYAQLHAAVTARAGAGRAANPYELGLALMERVAEAGGDEALFETRTLEDDVSLMRNWLDRATLERLGMVAAGGDWEAARAHAVAARAHGGVPRITAGCDAGAGTLVLTHHHEGLDLDLLAVDKTLPHAHTLWQGPVELHTRSGGRSLICTYDGFRTEKKYG